MPKIFNSSVPYLLTPCERCNSKRIISKTWTEEIQTSIGKTTIENTQIICSNPQCQAKFDKNLRSETHKRKEAKKIKEEAAIERKRLIAKAPAASR